MRFDITISDVSFVAEMDEEKFERFRKFFTLLSCNMEINKIPLRPGLNLRDFIK